MPCPGEEQFALLLAGSLDPSERLMLEEHVAQCDDCRMLLSELGRDATPVPREPVGPWKDAAAVTRQPDRDRHDGSHEHIATCASCQELVTRLGLQQRPASSRRGNPLPPWRLPEPGTVVAGRYRIDDVVGGGGMARVYGATHLVLRKRVALKMALPNSRLTADEVVRFTREAEAMAALEHPNIARVLDAGVSEFGAPFLVMELLEGRPLAELADGSLRPQVAVEYVLEAAAGLHYAHGKGVVHRDIKPLNLFLVQSETGSVVKVLDFGLVKLATSHAQADLTDPDVFLGTPRYMAPEQFRSSRHVDAAADIWALGITLYELLTGDAPFPSAVRMAAGTKVPAYTKASERRKGIPRGMDAVIARCLMREPADRYASVAAFALALAPFADSVPRRLARAWAAGGPVTPGTDTGYQRWLAVAGVAIVVLIGAIVALALLWG